MHGIPIAMSCIESREPCRPLFSFWEKGSGATPVHSHIRVLPDLQTLEMLISVDAAEVKCTNFLGYPFLTPLGRLLRRVVLLDKYILRNNELMN